MFAYAICMLAMNHLLTTQWDDNTPVEHKSAVWIDHLLSSLASSQGKAFLSETVKYLSTDIHVFIGYLS